MGYRNDVRFATTIEGFERLKKLCDDNLREKIVAGQIIDYAPLVSSNTAETEYDVFEERDGEVVFGWDWIKWSEYYDDVNQFMQVVELVWEEDEIPLLFIRVGEDTEDIEFDRNYDHRLNTTFYVKREIVF